MPVFTRPRRVIIDEGGLDIWPLLGVAAVVVAVAVIWPLLGDILLAAGITLAVAIAGLLVVLVRVLRRPLCGPVRAAVPGPVARGQVGGGERRAISSGRRDADFKVTSIGDDARVVR